MITYFPASLILFFVILIQILFKYFYFHSSLFFEQDFFFNIGYLFLAVLCVAFGEQFASGGRFKFLYRANLKFKLQSSSRMYSLLPLIRRLSFLLVSIAFLVLVLQLSILLLRYISFGSIVSPGELRAYLNMFEDSSLPAYFYIIRILASSYFSILILSSSLKYLVKYFDASLNHDKVYILKVCNVAILFSFISSLLAFLEGSRNFITVFLVFYLYLLLTFYLPYIFVKFKHFLLSNRLSFESLRKSVILIVSIIAFLYIFDVVGSQRTQAFYLNSKSVADITNSFYALSGISDTFENPENRLAVFYLTHSLDRISDILSNSSYFIFRFQPSIIFIVPYRILCTLGFSPFCYSTSVSPPGYIEGLFHGAIGELILCFGLILTLFFLFVLGFLHSFLITKLVNAVSCISPASLFNYLCLNVAYISLSSAFIISPFYLLYFGSTFLFFPQVLFFTLIFPSAASLFLNKSRFFLY